MSNPSVTFRISPKDRGRLDQLAAKTGKSFGQLLRENLGIAERDEGATYHRAWNEGYEAGHSDGVSESKKKFAIYYRCNVCDETLLVVPKGPEHQAIVNTLYSERWGHVKCQEASR